VSVVTASSQEAMILDYVQCIYAAYRAPCGKTGGAMDVPNEYGDDLVHLVRSLWLTSCGFQVEVSIFGVFDDWKMIALASNWPTLGIREKLGEDNTLAT
jgi:hypothetical protein